MPEASSLVKIPRDRIGVLIGPKASAKSFIEQELKIHLTIDSDTGNIEIRLTPDTEDPSMLFRAKEIVTAIGRGFSLEKARRLIDDEETMLTIIDLRVWVGKSESDIKRLSGRIIGREGKTRRTIEELTDTYVSVYGHTICIIGASEETDIARQAVEMFLRGRLHASVYKFLHTKRRDLKKKKLALWKEPYEQTSNSS